MSFCESCITGEHVHPGVVMCMLMCGGGGGTGRRGPVCAFAGLCCRSNRLRTAGSCDMCDACSDENADRGGGGVGRGGEGVLLFG